jgi:predicted enzyme related to lactoylglutathione lyase
LHVRGIDFAVLAVPDMATAQTFYRDTLGLQPIDEDMDWSEYAAGDGTIALLNAALLQDGHYVEPGWRNAILALAVQDVPKALEEMRGKGVDVLEETFEWNVCFRATIADPFGNRLFLHQRKDGTAG